MKALILVFFTLSATFSAFADENIKNLRITAFHLFADQGPRPLISKAQGIAQDQNGTVIYRDREGATSVYTPKLVTMNPFDTISEDVARRLFVWFILEGTPKGSEAELKTVITSRTSGLKSPITSDNIDRIETKTTAIIGGVFQSKMNRFYSGNYSSGLWRIEIWYGDRLLAEREFVVDAI